MAKRTVKPDLTYITPQNWNLHKLSDIMESVANDVKAAVKAGFTINMDTWMDVRDSENEIKSNSQCSVCLGGSVLLGFCTPPPSFKQLVIKTDKRKNHWNGALIIEHSIDDRASVREIVGKENQSKAWELAGLMDTYRNGDRDYFAKEAARHFKFNSTQELIIKAILEEIDIHSFDGQLDEYDIDSLLDQISQFVKHLRNIGM